MVMNRKKIVLAAGLLHEAAALTSEAVSQSPEVCVFVVTKVNCSTDVDVFFDFCFVIEKR